MEQPTPPSPAASTGDIAQRKHLLSTSNSSSFSRSQATTADSLGQLTYNGLVYGEGCRAYTSLPGHISSSQDNVFSTYSPSVVSNDTFHGSVSAVPYNSAFARYTPETSPPAQIQSANAIPTRSKHSSLRTGSTKGRRVEKKSRDTKRLDPLISIGKPLSGIALEVPEVEVPDATEFATRPIEVRREEAAKAGKIKRPLNAFMLYRKTYQNVAKTRCTRNNHQQVSAVCGDSWTSWEPPGILSEFNRLAGVEKQMHEQAFPHYKYDPILAKKPADNRDVVSTLASDTSDLEHGGHRRSTKLNLRKRGTRNAIRRSEPQKIEHSEAMEIGPPLHGTLNSNGFWGSPALRPLPMPYDGEQLTYFNHYPIQEQFTSIVDDHIISRSPSPITQCLEHSLMDPNLAFVEAFIDPALLPGSPGVAYGGFLQGVSTDPQHEWCQRTEETHNFGDLLPDLDGGGSLNVYLKGKEQDWEIEQLTEANQFNDWLSQTEGVGMWE